MFFLAATLIGWIGGDFVYRKVAAKNRVDLVGWLHIERWYIHPKTVNHPSTNWAWRGLTPFMQRTLQTTMYIQVITWSDGRQEGQCCTVSLLCLAV